MLQQDVVIYKGHSRKLGTNHMQTSYPKRKSQNVVGNFSFVSEDISFHRQHEALNLWAGHSCWSSQRGLPVTSSPRKPAAALVSLWVKPIASFRSQICYTPWDTFCHHDWVRSLEPSGVSISDFCCCLFVLSFFFLKQCLPSLQF